MTTGRRRRRGLGLFALGAMLLVATMSAPLVAVAQQGLEVALRNAVVQEDGTTRVVVDVAGVPPDQLDEDSFSVAEEGEDVGDLTVGQAQELGGPARRTVMLAVDVSDSTAGEPRANAVAASRAFAQTLTDRGVAVGLVQFSADVTVLVEPTMSFEEVSQALDDLTGGSRTRLYDAVVESANVLDRFVGQRDIVVFTDGADLGSNATLDDATSAANGAGAAVTAVALRSADLDEAPLEAMADDTGGRVLFADDVDELAGAFADVADNLDSQFIIEYPSTGRTGMFEVAVAVTVDGVEATTTGDVLGPEPTAPEPSPEVVAVGGAGLLGAPWVAPVGVALVTVALLLLLLTLLVPVTDRAIARNLAAALPGGARPDSGRDELTPATAAMSRRAVELIEMLPRPEGYDQDLQLRLDRAGWPLRNAEFTTLRALAALVGLGLGWALLGSLLFGIVVGAAGWVIPNIVLGSRVAARRNAFMDQLPDTLQLLAGSLKAGYGVLQAIDMVVKETTEPTRAEFQRVLSEARLGLPLEQSLDAMAERIGAEDFRWVAVAINIQRRVGGNLAQLLETVADTMRERAATRRQVRTLSAEGRLSALILVILPFGLAGYMLVVSPSYVLTLFSSTIGIWMVIGTVILMVIGIVWMRNLVEIDV